MDITPLIQADSQVIQSYSPGKFRISGMVYEHPVIVYPDRVEEFVFDGNAAEPVPEDFKGFLNVANDAEVVLFGGGGQMPFLKSPVKQAFADKGISVEPMDTGAACRTYNVLLSEGRLVAAILLPV